MPKFLFLYRDPAEKNGPELSADEMQAHIQKWWEWLGNGQEAGWVVAMGDALSKDGRVLAQDMTVTDGPFVESKEMVGGYSLIQAEDYEAACEHAKGCPIFETGGAVEIRQIADLSAPE